MDDVARTAVAEAAAQLWRIGEAWRILLDEGQQEWRRRIAETPGNHVLLVGRQRGKSFCALALAVEQMHRSPGTIVRYCAKTKDSALGIVLPNLAAIEADCPESMRLRKGRTENNWLAPNGSELVVFGTDAQSFDKGRGPRSHLIILDECGFYQDLEAVESALLPSLQTTGGRALYVSTPPISLGHPYVSRIRAAQAAGTCIRDTFWSNPRINHEAIIATEAARLGMTREQLLASTYFRREYLAELVQEESRAAFPAWNDEMRRRLVVDVPRPAHFDGYVGLDLGFSPDPHGALYAWHTPKDGLYIEDELELRGHTVAQLAEKAKAREVALWGVNRFDGTLLGAGVWEALPEWWQPYVAGSKEAPRQPFLRVGDDNKLVLAELISTHGLGVLPTRKDDKALAVDAAHQMLIQGRIHIHPRCVRLIEQLYTTTWNRTRSEWERTDKDHGDLVDALVYIARNVRWHRDPAPPAPVDPWQAAIEKPKTSGLAQAFMRKR